MPVSTGYLPGAKLKHGQRRNQTMAAPGSLGKACLTPKSESACPE